MDELNELQASFMEKLVSLVKDGVAKYCETTTGGIFTCRPDDVPDGRVPLPTGFSLLTTIAD